MKMKHLLILSIFFSSVFSSDSLRVATVPWQSEKELFHMYQPLIKLLEEKTNKKVNFFVTKDYLELSKRVLSKTVDIAIFGANTYVEAKYENPNLIYLGTSMQPEDHYNSLIISRKDSNIKTLNDLKGKRFAFTDIGSTSGYVYPNLILHNVGINPEKDFKSITMLKKHYKVYQAVASGSIDAGGCSLTYYEKAVEKSGDIFHIIKKSDNIPEDPIVAGSHLDKKFIKELKTIFKEANNSGYFEKYPTMLKGISIKDDTYYDIVRSAKKFMKENK